MARGAWIVVVLAFSTLVCGSRWGGAREKVPEETLAEAGARHDIAAALKAEADGDNEQRSALLLKAWNAAPHLAEVNWHTGRVQVEGEWLTLGEAVHRTASEADLVLYERLRGSADEPKELRELARWCQKRGFPDRARLHYVQLMTHPATDARLQQEAVKELDLRFVGGTWLTAQEQQARVKSFEYVQRALALWRPKLKKLQPVIDGEDFSARDRAVAELQAIDDAASISTLESFLHDGGPAFQEAAVKRLAGFPHFEASQALARYAVLSAFPLARSAATDALKKRPLHEFMPLLLGGLEAPLKSQFQIRADGSGRIEYVHAFLKEAPSSNMLLVAHQVAAPREITQTINTNPTNGGGRTKGSGRSAQPEIRRSRVDAFIDERQKLANQAALNQAALELSNARLQATNERIVAVLQATTNERRQEPSEWWAWWRQYNEYQWPQPTQFVYQPHQYAYFSGAIRFQEVSGQQGRLVRVGPSQTIPLGAAPRAPSCFVAGTVVRTETGQRPIETILPGDRVLAQDPDSGELAYKLVLKTTLRPPTKMLRLTIGDDTLVTTLGHPLWVSGQGWKMAKELALGDLVHGLGGGNKVEKVAPDADAQAYNLIVDELNTYFVGVQGLLVHDNEFRRPTRAVVPGPVAAE